MEFRRRRSGSPRITFARAFGLACVFVAVAFIPALAQDYLGSEFCSRCHMDQYNDWKVSGHPYKLTEAAKSAPVS